MATQEATPAPRLPSRAGAAGARWELLVLLGAAAAPFLPLPWAIALVALAGALLLARRPPLRETLIVGAGVALALAALVTGWALGEAGRRADWERAAGLRYAALWRSIVADAEAATATLPRPPAGTAQRLEVFRTLNAVATAPHENGPGSTLLLVDPDGEPVAWGGPGLLHELPASGLPRAGAHSVQSFGAATLLAVQPLDAARRPWRIVAGRSFATDRLPFPLAPEGGWAVLPPGAAPRAGTRLLAAPGAPTLVVEPRSPPAPSPWPGRMRRAAWAALGLALVALATLRAVGFLLPERSLAHRPSRPLEVGVLAVAGIACCALAAGATPLTAAVLTGGLALAALGLGLRRGALPAWVAVAGGVAGGGLLAAVAGSLVADFGRLDLAAAVVGGAEDLALRLALAGFAAGLLAVAGRRARTPPAGGWAWAAVATLAVAGAFHDRPLAATPLLAAGCGAAARWLAGASPLRRAAHAAALTLIAALAAAVAWESAYRLQLRRDLLRLLPGLAPPAQSEMEELRAATRAHFERLDLAAMAPVDPESLDLQDLAFAIWRHSPLARRNALSAVSVLHHGGRASSFSFGLPLAAGLEIDREPGRWQTVELRGWDELAVAGEAPLRAGGAPVATLRYWLFPRPGFRLGGREDEDIELALLRGGPAALGVEGLPPPARYALYAEDGRAVRVPWREAPPLAQVLRRGGRAVVPIPGGRAWAVARVEADGVEVVYLPLLGPRAALDRAGTHALATLLLLAAAALVILLLGLPRSAFRDTLRRTLRSYSKRLILVYSLLLLAPLVLLNLVLARGLEERLRREQRAAGEAALASAQRVLGEYVLTLDPGFGVATALDDPLLVWLASVVHHDVSLYWGSSVYASSRRELFTAGLLPRRIPGEVYSRLALLGYGLAARTSRAGGATYLELYGPVRVPGVPAEEEGLALSLPLLAQQAEVTTEIAYLRRQALLGTAALFLLLVAVGTRFARSFTMPLTELVRGTQRIAAGARSLEVRPAEVELQALSEAIDRMAQGIAEGRERLVREKQFVERVVENITAGVVSLDGRGHVLMANRVAAELLGVRVGEPLADVLTAAPRLAAVRAFVEGAGRELRQATVRLPGTDGEREWTLVWAPVPGAGEPSALLVVEDSTEVLRGQRLQAWAEMARIIAHEIKNPLTPIRLSAEHMRQVYGGDPERFGEVFERCTTNILRQVDELRQIAGEFSAYSHIPQLELRPGELVAAVAEVVESYRAAPPTGVEIAFRAPPEPVTARFDVRLLARAVRNLVENALRATVRGGRVEVRVEVDEALARIVVADDGPGVPAELLARIFDPYFSTHAAGTGLGLPIASRIAEEHGGRVTARNLPAGGLEVAITIPRS